MSSTDNPTPSRTVSTQVAVAQGQLRGTTTASGLLAFRGIPYAAPPVGNLRFRAPAAPSSWAGVRNASYHGPVAPQRVTQSFSAAGPETEQSEDCLTLSVLTPQPSPDASPRPVLVWFHGGAFSRGAGSAPAYSADALAERGDIVVVTVNYRLGALGFLDFSQYSTPHRTFESNLGLRDQVAALEWVRDNIAAFGGDPSQVTIAGQSSGGTAVTTLLCVPSAHGLFHRAIAQSPMVAAAYSPERAGGWARDFINWLRTTESLAVDALLSAPPKELVNAGARLAGLVPVETPGAQCMSPVVDGDFLPEHPIDAFAAGRSARVPLLIGSTKHEGIIFTGPGSSEVPTASEAINLMFEITDPGAQLKVLSAYPGYPSLRARAQLGGDAIFWVPSVEAAQGHAVHSPTFVYRYDLTTPALNIAGQGGGHGTELVPVFGALDSPRGRSMTWLGGREELAGVSDRMQESWLSFVRTGAPVAGWPTYDDDDRPTMVFAARDRVISDPGRERRRAWDGVASYR